MGLVDPSGAPILSNAGRAEQHTQQLLLQLISFCLNVERQSFARGGARALEDAGFGVRLAEPEAILPPRVLLLPGFEVQTKREQNGVFAMVECHAFRLYLAERVRRGEETPEFGLDPLEMVAAGFRLKLEELREERRARRAARSKVSKHPAVLQ